VPIPHFCKAAGGSSGGIVTRLQAGQLFSNYGSHSDCMNIFVTNTRYFDKCIKSDILKCNNLYWQCSNVDLITILLKRKGMYA
jgi:hypothetical protein